MASTLPPAGAASGSAGDDLEQALFQRVLEQDVDALGALLQRWRPWLMGRVRRDLGRSQPGGRRPSDLVQESCVLAVRFLSDFQGTSRQELRGWLTRILHTAVQQALRHSRADMRADTRTAPLSDDPVLPNPRLSQLISAREGYRSAVVAIARLPARQRDVLYWRLLEERSLSEIAERIADTEQAAASLIKRGLAKLRARLQLDEKKTRPARAVQVDAALAEYLRLCDRGQPPVREEFLRRHPSCAASVASLLDWLHDFTQRIADR